MKSLIFYLLLALSFGCGKSEAPKSTDHVEAPILLDAAIGLYGKLPKGWQVETGGSSWIDAVRTYKVGPQASEEEELIVYVVRPSKLSVAEATAKGDESIEKLLDGKKFSVFIQHRKDGGPSAETKALTKSLRLLEIPKLPDAKDAVLLDAQTRLWGAIPTTWSLTVSVHEGITTIHATAPDQEHGVLVQAYPVGTKLQLEETNKLHLFDSKTHQFVLSEPDAPTEKATQRLTSSLRLGPVHPFVPESWKMPAGKRRLMLGLGVAISLPEGWKEEPDTLHSAEIKKGGDEIHVGPGWGFGPADETGSVTTQVVVYAVPESIAVKYDKLKVDARAVKALDAGPTVIYVASQDGASAEIVAALTKSLEYVPRPQPKGVLQLLDPPSGLRAWLPKGGYASALTDDDTGLRTFDVGQFEIHVVANEKAFAAVVALESPLVIQVASNEDHTLFVDGFAEDADEALISRVLASITLMPTGSGTIKSH